MKVCVYDIKNFRYNGENIESTYFAKRVNEYKSDETKSRTYATYLMLKFLAEKCFKQDIDKLQIVRDETGKPRLVNNEFYFNISHSNNLVAVAVDKRPLGIDVQVVSPYDEKIAQRFFPKKINKINKQKEKNKNNYFTMCWTDFESELKLFGSIEKMQENRKKVSKSPFKIKDLENNIYYLTIATIKLPFIKFIKMQENSFIN